MPYTPPNVFVDGNPLLASKLEENQAALRAYVEKIPAADFSTAPWVEAGHVHAPRTIRISQGAWRWEGVSGAAGSIYRGFQDQPSIFVPYINAMDFAWAGTAGKKIHVPLTWVTLPIRRDAVVTAHYWAHPVGQDNKDGTPAVGRGWLYPVLGEDTDALFGKSTSIPEEDSGATFERWADRRAVGDTVQGVFTGRSNIHFGLSYLISDQDLSSLRLLSYGALVEVYYL